MYHIRLATLLICLAAPFMGEARGETLRVTVLAEEFWPYSYVTNDDPVAHPDGILIDFVTEVLTHAGAEFEIRMLPWPRVMKHLSEDENQLVLTLIRTPEREAMAQWIGQVGQIDHALYRLRTNPDSAVRTLAAARPLSVATVADDVAHDYLVGRGFERTVTSPNYLKGLEMLLRGRVDLYPGNSSLIGYQCEQIPGGCEDLEVAVRLVDLNQQLYLAMSNGTEAQVVARISDSYQALIASGRLAALRAAYFEDASE